MGTHRVVAAVLDPHHGQIRRIRVETVELLRQEMGSRIPQMTELLSRDDLWVRTCNHAE
jgi:hypothetical protein